MFAGLDESGDLLAPLSGWSGGSSRHHYQAPLAASLGPTKPNRSAIACPTKPPQIILSGTPFQLKAWRALLEIPFGETRSYGQLAEAMGSPSAARAAGSAIGANLLGYLVPCHRIIRDTGQTGQYRWGAQRKVAILNWEATQLAAAQANR